MAFGALPQGDNHEWPLPATLQDWRIPGWSASTAHRSEVWGGVHPPDGILAIMQTVAFNVENAEVKTG